MYNRFCNKRTLKMNENRIFTASSKCHICNVKSHDETNLKVPDVCHSTGKFLGAAHRKCIPEYRLIKHVPVIFHNLSQCDTKLLIEEFTNYTNESNSEIHIKKMKDDSIMAFNVLLINSLQLRFMKSSLFIDSDLFILADNLDENEFKVTKSNFKNISVYTNPVKKKRILPYKLFSLEHNFFHPEIPQMSSFCNSITNEAITKDDYAQVQVIWTYFNIRNIGGYLDLHLKSNVTVLSDVFECYRSICNELYTLDLMHYISIEELAFDAMLKETRISLDDISDIKIIEFLQKGLRGTITQCSPTHHKANNKYMSSYDPNIESKFLIHIRANNLINWALSQKLPYDDFEWFNVESIPNFDVRELDEHSHRGYIFEVDLEYPENLHQFHRDFPVCPDHITPKKSKIPKLQSNFLCKTKYIIHLRVLKQYLNLGLNLIRIHRVLTFRQNNWLKPFVERNSIYNQPNENINFRKNILHSINIAIYNKLMENNERNHSFHVISNKASSSKLEVENIIAMPNYHKCIIISKNCVAIERELFYQVYNKPIYIQFTLRELLSSQMYYFHYNVMKEKYKNHLSLLFADINSIIYEIQTPDFYNDIKHDSKIQTIFNKMPSNDNYATFRDECDGNILLLEFIGSHSKSYALKLYCRNLIFPHSNDEIENKIEKETTSVIKYSPSLSRFNLITKALNKSRESLRK